MKIIILGAAGFIGTNLTIKLAENLDNEITLVDKCIDFFEEIRQLGFANVMLKEDPCDEKTDWDSLLEGQDVVYLEH